jgi:hypothetical protein
MANTFYANQAWVSVFLGWLAKILVLRYGGGRMYRNARPFILGMITGEVFAAALWAVDPAVRTLLGLPYKVVQVQPF